MALKAVQGKADTKRESAFYAVRGQITAANHNHVLARMALYIGDVRFVLMLYLLRENYRTIHELLTEIEQADGTPASPALLIETALSLGLGDIANAIKAEWEQAK